MMTDLGPSCRPQFQRKNPMEIGSKYTGCVLLADSHHGLSEGIRRLLATAFEMVVMVADEPSLFESARRLESELAIIDFGLAEGNPVQFIRRFCVCFENTKVIIISGYDVPSVVRSALD